MTGSLFRSIINLHLTVITVIGWTRECKQVWGHDLWYQLTLLKEILAFPFGIIFFRVTKCSRICFSTSRKRRIRQFPSFLSPLFQSESKCEAFRTEISFIHTQIVVHLHVNKTNFHTRPRFETKAKGNSEIAYCRRENFLI